MAEEHPPSPVLKVVPFAWEIAGQARYDSKRLGLSLMVNNKSMAKIVLFAILFRFGLKILLLLYLKIKSKMMVRINRMMKLTPCMPSRFSVFGNSLVR